MSPAAGGEAEPVEASATEADATEASATEASATEASATEADATEADATEASETEADATEDTVTHAGDREARSTMAEPATGEGTGRHDDYVQAEIDIRARMAEVGLDLDFAAMSAVSNVYRAASAIRNHMEQTVLARYDLSWTAFTTLFVLWIWGDLESRHLAARAGVTKGTLTGVVRTLSNRGLCWRGQREDDRRFVLVGLTPRGGAVIEELFPRFNEQETLVTSRLSEEDKAALAAHLRALITTLDGD